MAAHYQSAPGPSRQYHPQAFPSSPSPPTHYAPPAPRRTDHVEHQPGPPPSNWRQPYAQNGPTNGLGLEMPMPAGYRSPSPANAPRQIPQPASHVPQAQAPQRQESAPAPPPKSKPQRNPFADLQETERTYIAQLTLIIRRVAAAWSRKDLPPPKLDAMFRCIEAVYRVNRAFGSKLREVADNPSEPKLLGDLLMRWVDDLEPSYGRYVSIYLTGFDNYQPIVNNTLLPPILDEVSVTSPPTPPLERWTLDALFLLPYARLRYYRKLYARLLSSTTEGRSDHRMLQTASQRLESLVNDIEARLECDVSDDSPTVSTAPSVQSDPSCSANDNDKPLPNRSSSGMGSSVETQSVLSGFNSRVDSTHSSATSTATSINQSPGRSVKAAGPGPSAQAPPITDLELRIDTDRTIDLFNMQLRKCRLQMSPPNLPFERTIRSSHDATIYFTPSSTGQQVVHRRAHIFVLTDLFLITDRMEAAEKAARAQQVARDQPNRVGEGGPMPEMWLAYPPLAGKHLIPMEGEQSNVVAITVMRKETFVIHTESEIERDLLMKSVAQCIEFASGAPPRPTITTTPMPTARVGNSPIDGPGHAQRLPSPHSPGGHQAMSPAGPMSPTSQTGHLMSPNTTSPSPTPTDLSGQMRQLNVASSNGSCRSQEQDQQLPSGAAPRAMPTRSMSNGYPGPNSPGQPMPPHDQYMRPGQHIPGPGQHMPAPGQPMPAPGQHMPGPGQHMPAPGQHMPGPGQRMSGPGGHHIPSQHTGPGQPRPEQHDPHGQPPMGYPVPGKPRIMLSDDGRPNTPSGHPSERMPSGPSRSVSVHSSTSAHSGTSAQSSNYGPPGTMSPYAHNGMPGMPRQPSYGSTPLPNRAGVGLTDKPLPSTRQEMLPPRPFGRTATNYSDSGLYPGNHSHLEHAPPPRSRSAEPMYDMAMSDMGHGMPLTGPPAMPSAHFAAIKQSESSPLASPVGGNFDHDDSPPPSPKEDFSSLKGPTIINAQMKCKVFAKQGHQQWKSHGQGKLKLYVETSTRQLKQLVVENGSGKGMLISTIVLTDGVERVGRTGVAVEISDRGHRTGIIYMIQLRNEAAAEGLHQSLLAGSDRARR